MMIRRLQKLGTAVCLILSLLAAAVSACACHHHNLEAKAETAPACHHHETGAKAPEPEAGAASVSDCDCRCVDSAGRLSAKSEPIKIRHQVLATANAALKFTVVEAAPDTRLATFEKPHFLTDSFYNLSPGRAPPRS